MKRWLLLLLFGCAVLSSCKKQDVTVITTETPEAKIRHEYLKRAVDHMVGNYQSAASCGTIDSLGNWVTDTTYTEAISVTGFQDTILVVGTEHLNYDASFDSTIIAFVYTPPSGIYYEVAIVDTGFNYFSFYRFSAALVGQGFCSWRFY